MAKKTRPIAPFRPLRVDLPKKKKPAAKSAGALPPVPEDVEQAALARWLDFKGLLYAHVPNGGLRNIIFARKLKAMGVKAGVPDILIFTPPPGSPPGRAGTAIELKRRDIRKATKEQEAWLKSLNLLGWNVRVCSGADAAIAYLTELGY